jgi:hypothetical protein
MTRRYHWISRDRFESAEGDLMLSATVIVLLVLWVIAMITGNTLGGLAHVLLIGAAVIFVVRMARGQSPLRRG